MVRLVSLADMSRAFNDRFYRLVKTTSEELPNFYVSGDDVGVATRFFRVYEERRDLTYPLINVDLMDNKITIREREFFDIALALAKKYELLEPGVEFTLETH